ncbi:MAG: hypothetical protein IAF02_23145 [Anaerolineae bacterium]|nr:hypothetical protein [Anaerolineae bacterium]
MIQMERLQSEIEALPYKEFVRLREWFANKDWEVWDKQIEADSESSKLDFLFEEALVAKSNNTLQEL